MANNKNVENKELSDTLVTENTTEIAISPTPAATTAEADAPRWLVLTLQTLAYAIPLGFLAYVLYINYLPFGYNQTFTIDVGAEGDTTIDEFYLEPSRYLSERKVTDSNDTYRTLDGLAFAKLNLNDYPGYKKISVSTMGGQIVSPIIERPKYPLESKYYWDFTINNKSGLIGSSYFFDGCEYFDGKSNLSLPESYDLFESGPFSVFIEWSPEATEKDFQQLVGHFNWELLQNRESVSFQVGRMNDGDGPFYSIEFPLPEDFFGRPHWLLATYSPSEDNGYIQLYVDGVFVERNYIGSTKIWGDYNGMRNLSFGKSEHGAAEFFEGCIYKSFITDEIYNVETSSIEINSEQNVLRIPISGNDDSFNEVNVSINN
jgi:hypothetical protein